MSQGNMPMAQQPQGPAPMMPQGSMPMAQQSQGTVPMAAPMASQQLPGNRPPPPHAGNNLPEKLYSASEEAVGEKDAPYTVAEKSSGFVEDVSEFAGRLFGQVKTAIGKGGDTTKAEASKTKDFVSEGWVRDKSKDPAGTQASPTHEIGQKPDEDELHDNAGLSV